MKTLAFILLGSLMGMGLLALARQQPVEAKPAVEVVDHTYCRAKLANWVMRHEELAKPEKEMWKSFREYMTSECVK